MTDEAHSPEASVKAPSDDPSKADGALDWITIEGLRSIRSLRELEIRPINVLIGANGSGKSNIVEGFALLHALAAGRLHRQVHRFGGADRFLHSVAESANEITLGLSFGEGREQYRVVLERGAADDLRVASEVIRSGNGTASRSRAEPLAPNGREAGISAPDLRGPALEIRRRLDSWRVYHFHDTSEFAPLRKTADVHDRHALRADGANLPAFLLALRETHPRTYTLIRRAVQFILPFLDDFVLRPFGKRGDAVRLGWTHRNSDESFDVRSLSDGALRFIALATLFQQPSELRPGVFLLDEPELGMHPAAINLLAAMVRSASAEGQVVLTTQSPILLDYFAPEDLIVCRRENGETRTRRHDSEALAVWLEDSSLGELWEQNYLGGRPLSDEAGAREGALERGVLA